MLCYRRFFSLRSAVFLALLFTFLLTIIKTNDTFATTIECQDFSSSLNYDNPTSVMLNKIVDIRSYCDTSSLNQSSRWYYIVSFDYDNSGTSSYPYIWVARNNYITSTSPSSFITQLKAYTTDSFSGFTSDSYSDYSDFYLRYYYFLVSLNYRLNSDQYLHFTNFSLTISDSSPDCGFAPSGSLSITENGTYDVTSYVSAVVDVPPIPGDYHEDLVNIRTSIYTCGAILLVLYFFYCIYRMIIRGVKK